jgi:hypothetical protein
LEEFNSQKNGPLHEQTWALNKMKKFVNKIYSLNQFYCISCKESWPSYVTYCKKCQKSNIYTAGNNMDPLIDIMPNHIKKVFESATFLEQLLISPIIPVMSVYRLSSGHLVNKGYCAAFVQNIQPICDMLPRIPKEVDLLLIKKKSEKINHKDLMCSRFNLQIMLEFLTKHNYYFKVNNIKIAHENLLQIPIHGIPNDLHVLDENDNFNDENDIISDNFNNENETRDNNGTLQIENLTKYTLIDIDLNIKKEVDKIKAIIDYPKIDSKPINEYEKEGIFSLIFPTLFPYGKGDPTTLDRITPIKEQECCAHLMTYACRDSENIMYYPFQSHPRFIFYASDRIKRAKANAQCTVYLKQNIKDKNMTVDEFKNLSGKYIYIIVLVSETLKITYASNYITSYVRSLFLAKNIIINSSSRL